MKKVIYLVCFLLVLSCSQKIPSTINFQEWRNDSCGFLHNRESISDSIVKYKSFFITMDTAQLFQYLGKPNDCYNDMYLYYVSPGPKCDSRDSSGVAIDITINKRGKVKQLYKVLLD